jgi:hypothetical protein
MGNPQISGKSDNKCANIYRRDQGLEMFFWGLKSEAENLVTLLL